MWGGYVDNQEKIEYKGFFIEILFMLYFAGLSYATKDIELDFVKFLALVLSQFSGAFFLVNLREYKRIVNNE